MWFGLALLLLGSWFWFLVLGRFGFGIDSIGINTVDGTWDGILGGGWGALGWDVGLRAWERAKRWDFPTGREHISRPPLNSRAELDQNKKRHTFIMGRAAPFLLPRPEGLHQHCTPRESSLLGDVRRFHGSGSGNSWWWCWWRRWWRVARGCYAGEWAGGAGGGGGRWAERHWRHGLRHWSVARGLGPATVPLFAC